MTQYHVEFDELMQCKEKYLKLGNATEKDIRDIWIKPGEDNDISNLVYNYTIPLYQKMIFRYRNANNKIIGVWNGIDPGNRRTLLSNFNIHSDDDRIPEFFAWICFSLAIYDINIIDPSLVDLWKKDDMHFFYFLGESRQKALIKRYNERQTYLENLN